MSGPSTKGIECAIRDGLISPNVCDSNNEAANVVDVVDRAARALLSLADAVTPHNALPGRDPDGSGRQVGCLTEAVMSIATALHRIANVLDQNRGRPT